MTKDFTKCRDEKLPSIDGIPTFFLAPCKQVCDRCLASI